MRRRAFIAGLGGAVAWPLAARAGLETVMIRNFTEHAANERTFLAWVRTGIAVIAFGFVVEKFNLFILVIANTAAVQIGRTIRTERLAGPLGHYEGLQLRRFQRRARARARGGHQTAGLNKSGSSIFGSHTANATPPSPATAFGSCW